jgi:uncharacterized protein involved in cysteine biosynthesis
LEAILGCLEGYFGLFEAILRHLGASWDQEFFRNLRPKITVPWLRHLVPFLGTKIIFLVFFGIIFWITFLSFFGPLFGQFWGPF